MLLEYWYNSNVKLSDGYILSGEVILTHLHYYNSPYSDIKIFKAHTGLNIYSILFHDNTNEI